ncbi:hypothetical protein C0995_009947 [Termitomyces sp. Mi166|nr:hypothetical protein C0995_009947 [Termitomyces sp. Mi166\
MSTSRHSPPLSLTPSPAFSMTIWNIAVDGKRTVDSRSQFTQGSSSSWSDMSRPRALGGEFEFTIDACAWDGRYEGSGERDLVGEGGRGRHVRKAKQMLEAEPESSSQALFEEANNIGATKYIRLADIEKLREAKLEKVQRSALRLLKAHASSPTSPVLPSTTAFTSISANVTPSSASTLTEHIPSPRPPSDFTTANPAILSPVLLFLLTCVNTEQTGEHGVWEVDLVRTQACESARAWDLDPGR